MSRYTFELEQANAILKEQYNRRMDELHKELIAEKDKVFKLAGEAGFLEGRVRVLTAALQAHSPCFPIKPNKEHPMDHADDFHKITALLERISSKLDMQIKAAERHAIGVHRLEHRLAALEAEVKNTNGKGRI